LEKIVSGTKQRFIYKEMHGEASIPPMLLMTFVENIFKHGIDNPAAIIK